MWLPRVHIICAFYIHSCRHECAQFSPKVKEVAIKLGKKNGYSFHLYLLEVTW